MTRPRRQQASSVFVPEGEGGLDRPSVALVHQLRVIDQQKLLFRRGELSAERLSQIEAVIPFVLGLPV